MRLLFAIMLSLTALFSLTFASAPVPQISAYQSAANKAAASPGVSILLQRFRFHLETVHSFVGYEQVLDGLMNEIMLPDGLIPFVQSDLTGIKYGVEMPGQWKIFLVLFTENSLGHSFPKELMAGVWSVKTGQSSCKIKYDDDTGKSLVDHYFCCKGTYM